MLRGHFRNNLHSLAHQIVYGAEVKGIEQVRHEDGRVEEHHYVVHGRKKRVYRTDPEPLPSWCIRKDKSGKEKGGVKLTSSRNPDRSRDQPHPKNLPSGRKDDDVSFISDTTAGFAFQAGTKDREKERRASPSPQITRQGRRRSDDQEVDEKEGGADPILEDFAKNAGDRA
ncbi:uncharacterized protein KY384_004019 [Bacidia gigantensis]|uniref:uncharacterized protein n=1 Tax=Bacidia gigantensis TaxID=2732470 RepID=UPI001D05B3AA|nr:uncharacterized protein KY384_004019 [Bacidia gigantensis]KAG8530664.1 hypothetical protein KY384_004019 [Bacidia gigantensis]